MKSVNSFPTKATLLMVSTLVLLPLVWLLLPEPTRHPQTDTLTSEPIPLPLQWILLTYGVALLSQIVFYLIPVQLPFYLQELANASVSQSGIAIALTTLFSAFASLNYQRIKSRLVFTSLYGIEFFQSRHWLRID